MTNLLILLHKREYQISLLGDTDSKLWVVKPLIICIDLDGSSFSLLIFLRLDWVWATSSLLVPLAVDSVLRPGAGEDLAEVNLVEVGHEVAVPHPPVAVVLKLVIELLPETLVVVPSLIIITEGSIPLAGLPRVSNSNHKQLG